MLTPAPAAPAPASEPIEHLIGEATAAAACALAQAFLEFQNGGLTPKTRAAGGDRIAELFALRQSTLGEINFEEVAREHGARALRKLGGSENGVYTATTDGRCPNSTQHVPPAKRGNARKYGVDVCLNCGNLAT